MTTLLALLLYYASTKIVPNVVGLHILDAKTAIFTSGFALGSVREVEVKTRCIEHFPLAEPKMTTRWCVVKQTPAGGTRNSITAVVNLEVSK